MPRSLSTSPPDALIETVGLARALIGATLRRMTPEGVAGGRIVEVEAYPPGDPASHAFAGLRVRNASMFLEPHRAYVYRIYGTSWCFNITSEPAGIGAAILVRALEPLEGIELMERRRGTTLRRDLCRGPGRLCTALGIDGSLDGARFDPAGPLDLAFAASPAEVGCSARIGISKAADRRLRFYLAGSPYLSGLRSLSP